MQEYCRVKEQTLANIKCPMCSLTSLEVLAMEVREGIGPETIVDAEDDDGTSTDLSATTETQTFAQPAPVTEPVPAREAVPAPETRPTSDALVQVILITTITCLLVSMPTINISSDVRLITDY